MTRISWDGHVIRHYLISAIRQIAKNKGVFAANVFGFALNFVVVIFGMNYVLFETSYDDFHENGDRIYRAIVTVPAFNNNTSPVTSGLLAPTLEDVYPEVETAIRIFYFSPFEFRSSPELRSESGTYSGGYADSDIFSVFSFGSIRPETIADFNRPNTAIISRTMSKRFFGDEDPKGRLLYSNLLFGGMVEVVGVMDDVPRNAHIRPEFFVSFATVPENRISWGAYQFLTYVLLIDSREATLHGFRANLKGFSSQYLPEANQASYTLEPLSEVYFSPFAFWGQMKGDINYLYFALAYLVLISFMTVANYVNINIAHLISRIKEIGLRKSFGAGKSTVVCQFVVETLINCLVAVVISIIGVLVLRASGIPLLEHLSRSEIGVEYIGFLGLAFLVIGLVSGICPAFVFYRISPVDMLANRVSGSWTANSLRKGLLFFQLAISVALLLLTGLVYNQVSYLTDKPMGYEKENKIVIPLSASAGWHERLTEQFERHFGVENVCSAMGYPGDFTWVTVPSVVKGTDAEELIKVITVGRNFLETLKIETIHGRSFVEDEFRGAVLLNESAFDALRLSEEDVDTEQEIAYERVRIVGVVSDFHLESLHHEIGPLMIKHRDSGLTHLIVDIQPSEREATLTYLSGTFSQLLPNNSFDYFFLDEKLDEIYQSDRQILESLLLLALVAFALALAGIYNYGVFFTLNRIREVAIRKIHGASAGDIVRMNILAISRSIALSLVIALPVVYYVYGLWIARYAFRADVSPLLVALPVLAIYVLTCTMVARETLKTAGMKPAEVIQKVQQ